VGVVLREGLKKTRLALSGNEMGAGNRFGPDFPLKLFNPGKWLQSTNKRFIQSLDGPSYKIN